MFGSSLPFLFQPMEEFSTRPGSNLLFPFVADEQMIPVKQRLSIVLISLFPLYLFYLLSPIISLEEKP